MATMVLFLVSHFGGSNRLLLDPRTWPLQSGDSVGLGQSSVSRIDDGPILGKLWKIHDVHWHDRVCCRDVGELVVVVY